MTGELGELGFGTQELPVSGRDIQDEKILGTMHVATGRSDHLGGTLTPDRFANKPERHARRHPVLAEQDAGDRRPASAPASGRANGRAHRALRAGGLHARLARRVNIYETDKLLAEYLLFHYGTAEEILPYRDGPREALHYPVRCVTECVDFTRLNENCTRARSRLRSRAVQL